MPKPRRTPYLPFYVGDFLQGTTEWTGEERALYMLALSYAWAKGSIPADVARLQRLLEYGDQSFASSWPTVSQKWTETDGRLYNERLEAHRLNAQAKGSSASENGRLGGLATQAKRKRLLTDTEASANLNSSETEKSAKASQSNPNQYKNPPVLSSPPPSRAGHGGAHGNGAGRPNGRGEEPEVRQGPKPPLGYPEAVGDIAKRAIARMRESAKWPKD